jgi:opacity protein-like surface antigen
MAVSTSIRRVRRLALLAAMTSVAGTSGAAMPGLYFAGFYMDSTLAYSSVDAKLAGFDREAQALWMSQGDDVEIVSWGSAISDSKDIGYAFAVGHQFSQYFAAELGYQDMGTIHYQAAGNISDSGGVYSTQTFMSAKTKGLVASAIAVWPLGDLFSLDARAGAFVGRTRMRYAVSFAGLDGRASEKNNTTTLTLGAGINWAMSPGTAIRAGYSRVSKAMIDDYDIGSWTLGLKYAW